MKYLLVGLMLGLFLIVLFSGCVTTNSIDTSTTNVNSLQINDCYHGKSYGVEGYNVDCVINSISNYNDCYSLSKIISPPTTKPFVFNVKLFSSALFLAIEIDPALHKP